MTDFEKILAVFETVYDYCQYGIKKTFSKGSLVALEINSDGNYWSFDPKTFSLLKIGRY